jgi:hypothetical protein
MDNTNKYDANKTLPGAPAADPRSTSSNVATAPATAPKAADESAAKIPTAGSEKSADGQVKTMPTDRSNGKSEVEAPDPVGAAPKLPEQPTTKAALGSDDVMNTPSAPDMSSTKSTSA